MFKTQRSPWVMILALCIMMGCRAQGDKAPAHLTEITSPAGSGSRQLNVSAGPGGELYLSWIEVTDAGLPALKFASRTADGWSAARSVVESEDMIVDYADFPSLLALGKGAFAAHWMSAIPDHEGYKVNLSVSQDDGQTWTKPVVPHRDGTPTEHGFLSMAAAPQGGVAAVWLDSRNLSGDKPASDEVAMMYTTIGLDGTLGPESVVDGRVCECCQTSAALVPEGILTVYRDRSKSEIRDITIVKFDGKQWSQPKTVFDDGWQINACPINGPAIAAQGRNVAVAWFTAANDKPKVQVAFSTDGGNTFGKPVQVDDGNPVGRVDVVVLESGKAFVSWLEKTDAGGEVRLREAAPDGTRQPSITAGKTAAGTSSGFPRMDKGAGSILLAWMDTNANRVRTATLPVN